MDSIKILKAFDESVNKFHATSRKKYLKLNNHQTKKNQKI